MKKLLTIFFTLFFSVSAFGDIAYQVSNIEEKFQQEEGSFHSVGAINNAGEITGIYKTSGFFYSQLHPFFIDRDGQLHVFKEYEISYTPTLNQRGQFAQVCTTDYLEFFARIGWNPSQETSDTTPQKGHVFLWDPQSGFEDLGAPKGWKNFWVRDMNDHGQILLERLDKTKDNEPQVAYWSEGSFHLIDPSILTTANTINNQGIIFGNFIPDESSATSKGILYSTADETVTESTPFPITFIWNGNDEGEFIARFIKENSHLVQGMISYGTEQQTLPIGFYPTLLNNHRQVIGNLIDKNISAIWDNGQIKEINSLLIEDPIRKGSQPIYVHTIASINDKGQMIAFGREVGQKKFLFLLLTPTESEGKTLISVPHPSEW